MNSISFQVKLAGMSVGIEHSSSEMRDFCADYLTDLPSQFSVSVTQADIDDEVVACGQRKATVSDGRFLYEISAVQRKIAEIFPLYNRFLMHGAAITYQHDAYLFCAPSGVGKSTHIALWKRYLGNEVDIINGDKPFLLLEDGAYALPPCVQVYGSPWAGKERWQKNRSAPLRAICFISRASENSIQRLQPGACLPQLMRQVYIPHDTETAGKTLELIDQLVNCIPLYHLYCNISEDAVKCSFESLTGLSYPIGDGHTV